MPGKRGIALLTLLLRRPLLSFFVVGLVAFVLAFFLIQLVNPPPHAHDSWLERLRTETQTTVTALVFAVLIVPVTIALVLRKTFMALISIARSSAEKGRAPVLPFLAETIEQMDGQLHQLQGQGVVLESYEVANWVRRCFQTAGPETRYLGTDSHVPSQYEDVYTDYLQAHSEILEKSSQGGHVRIMVVDIEKLRTDKFGVPDSFQEFLEWHHKKKVGLKRLDPGENRAFLEDPDDSGSFSDLLDTDIGFWAGKYALLFRPIRKKGEREKTLLRIAYFGEPLYEQCEAYMRWIEDSAADFTDDLPFYSDKLSTGWEDFCDPTERVRHTIPFIEEVIDQLPHHREDVRIFDAATGIGIETTELIRKKYFVAPNEIENSLRAAAERFAASRGVRIPTARFSKTDWLHLEDEHDQAVYDVVLVLGNSLCHLEGVEQLEVAIEQFARLLRPGGALVCDERNFDYIQRHWDQIHSDPWNNFRFNQRPASERVMYYGDSVLGAPVDRTESDRITFEYARVVRDEKGAISPEQEGEIGTLSMYPYEKGEMLSILSEDSSFERVEILCDLQISDTLRDDADFFTYIAWKGASTVDRLPPTP